MQHHWHGSIENILFVGLSALVFLNLWRIGAAWAARQDGAVGQIGAAAGGLVHFGS